MLVLSCLSYIYITKVVKKATWFMAEFQVVKESPRGSLTYPSDLPKDRGYMAEMCAVCSSAVLFSTGAYFVSDHFDKIADTLIYIGVAATNNISVFLFLHLVIKTFTFIEDYNHIHTRHRDSLFELLQKAYSFNIHSVLLGGFSLFLTPWAWHLYGPDYMFKFGYKPLLPIFAGCFFLQWLVKMDWSRLVDSVRVEKDMNGMDYGSGMAYSFFYGFLHIVLPVTGDANKGIQERIDDYIAREGLRDAQFPVKKLFILIPSSKYIPCSLHELSDGWMLPANNLEEQQFDVAGVRARSYKNSVYKIRDPDQSVQADYVYVVAEGATPLRTLNEVVIRSVRKSEFYREHQKEIIHMFFNTLRSILREDERTKNNCELIYYVDDDDHGDKINVAKLILDRIKELRNRDEDKGRRHRGDTART